MTIFGYEPDAVRTGGVTLEWACNSNFEQLNYDTILEIWPKILQASLSHIYNCFTSANLVLP